jgi:hypothetical protein
LRISCCAAYFLLCCGFSAALRRHALRAGSHSPGQKRRGETGSSAIREAGEIGTYRRVSASTPCAFILLTRTPASANMAVTQVSHDICTDVQAQHNTGLNLTPLSPAAQIVPAFQAGRFSGGGASSIGWATSTNGGAIWAHGYLPGSPPTAAPSCRPATPRWPSTPGTTSG